MSDYIVERLRAEATDNRRYEVNGTLAVEAADLITALRAENERLRAALERIREWSDAYPLDVFPEPDWKKSEAVLSAAGLSLSAISAANMRHVISGVGSIARAALEEGRT